MQWQLRVVATFENFGASRMDLHQTLSELSSLPVNDRLLIVESLWNSIDADTPVSIPPEQRKEISRRIERHKHHPDELLTWEQVLDGLRDRR
jgi:putative addiction module component (TIGR02574 family)